jgi:hypothetical protein
MVSGVACILIRKHFYLELVQQSHGVLPSLSSLTCTPGIPRRPSDAVLAAFHEPYAAQPVRL